jgi:ribosomal protein S15P/S13E
MTNLHCREPSPSAELPATPKTTRKSANDLVQETLERLYGAQLKAAHDSEQLECITGVGLADMQELRELRESVKDKDEIIGILEQHVVTLEEDNAALAQQIKSLKRHLNQH